MANNKKLSTLTIDFSNLGGPVYIGRPKGKLGREKYNLDAIDKSDVAVKVIIPENTYTINSSYFLGLFGDSIRAAGSREAFLKKFIFQCPEIFRNEIEKSIARALFESDDLL